MKSKEYKILKLKFPAAIYMAPENESWGTGPMESVILSDSLTYTNVLLGRARDSEKETETKANSFIKYVNYVDQISTRITSSQGTACKLLISASPNARRSAVIFGVMGFLFFKNSGESPLKASSLKLQLNPSF